MDGRNKIGGKEQTIIKTDNLVNNGTKIGDGGVTYVEAKSIKNQTTTNQLSEISGDNTYVTATDGNIENLGGKIRGTGLVSVVAENGQVINTSTKNTITRYNGEYDRTTHEEIASVGEISSQGTTYIEGQGYTSVGAITGGGEQTVIDVGDGNVNISSIALTGSDKFGSNSSNYSAYGSTQNIGSELQTENIQIKAANLNIKGSTVAAQTGYVDANVNIESSIDSVDTEQKSKTKGFLSKSSSETKSHQEENVAGTLYIEEQGYVTGNINSIGSNVILGENSYVGGKVTTDAQELNNSYYHTESKSGFQANFSTTNSSATGQIGYGKSSSTQTETSKIYAGSNLSIGNGSVLNNGASITATNFEYGQIQINNGNVAYGARVNEYDSSGSSSSSFFGVTATISSGFLGSASQLVDGATTVTRAGNESSISAVSGAVNSKPTGNIANQVNGSVELANGAVGMINGLASNQGTRVQTNEVVDGKTDAKAKEGAKANNDFYVSGSANIGFSGTESSYSSHQEEAVVTTLVPLDENSSITYNNVNNITYQGTVAQGGTFIYNGVENITKEAVELRNSSTNESINFGMNVGVGVGANGQLQQGTNGQTGVTLNMSAGLSNMNTEGTTYQNGTFVDVNEVHNGTGTMTLNGFNQVGGAVTGNIKDVKIISKQNTSTTDGESVNGSVGIPIMGGGAVTGSVGFSTTTGDRAYVDTPSSLIVGAGSNLTIGNGTNIGGIVGTTDGGSMVIKNYYGEDIKNHDTYNTTGASIGLITPTSGASGLNGITGFGVQYQDKDKEGTTHNTVIGNVSIGNATGDEINRDETKVQETTKNTDTGAIDAYVEGGVLDLLTESGREDFATNIKLAGKEISDIGDALNSSLNEQGKENRNFFGMLSERRQATTMDNMTHDLITALGDNAKPEDMNKIIVDAAAELGYKVEIIVSDPKNTPSLEEKNGEAHFDSKTGKMTVIINAEAPQNATTRGYMATAMEELSHVIAAKDGKRDLDIASTTDEKGSESLGRETADYFKDSYQDDSTSIDIKSDGKDYSAVDFGENVGNASVIDLKAKKSYSNLKGYDLEQAIAKDYGLTMKEFVEIRDILQSGDMDSWKKKFGELIIVTGVSYVIPVTTVPIVIYEASSIISNAVRGVGTVDRANWLVVFSFEVIIEKAADKIEEYYKYDYVSNNLNGGFLNSKTINVGDKDSYRKDLFGTSYFNMSEKEKKIFYDACYNSGVVKNKKTEKEKKLEIISLLANRELVIEYEREYDYNLYLTRKSTETSRNWNRYNQIKKKIENSI